MRNSSVTASASRRLWRVVAAVALVGSGVLLAAGQAGADGSLLFNGWDGLGGVSKGAPAATTWGPGRLDVFVRGSDDALWHKWFIGSWSGWESLGAPVGGLASDPAAVAWASGRIDVFAAGNNGHLWHKWYSGGWSGWEDLGGGVIGAPSVSSWAPGRLDVFVHGTDNRLWHKWYQSTWSGWEALGGVLQAGTGPAAVSSSFGHIDVFVHGTDDAAWHIAYAGGWGAFASLGGVLRDSPGVTSQGPGRVDLFVRGTDDRLYHQWTAGDGWSGWQPALTGVLRSGPAAVSWAAGRVDVFVRGTDTGIWHGNGMLPATQCTTSALSVSLQNGQGAAGHLFWDLTFTNTSSTPCFMSGFPGVSWVNGSGTQIGSPVARDLNVGNFGPVPLLPGGSAQALLGLTQVGNFDASVCGPVAAAGIRVFPPNQVTSKIVANPAMVCSKTTAPEWSTVSTVFSPTLSSIA